MAYLTGLWMYIVPRRPSEDVHIQGGVTIVLSGADKSKLGDSPMTVSIRVMNRGDNVSISNITLQLPNVVVEQESFQVGSANLNIGPNTFGLGSVIVPHAAVANSEPYPPWDDTAELYLKLRASGGGGVTTDSIQTHPLPARFK
jgi:hypothetical protein